MTEIIGLGRSAEVIAWGEGRVAKLYYEWVDEVSVEREFHATRQAYQSGIPVPQPYELVTQGKRKGIVLERVQGETMLKLFSIYPWRMPHYLEEFSALQAAYLTTPGEGLPSLKQHLSFMIRREFEKHQAPDFIATIWQRFDALPDSDRLCHMDFHVDNVMHTKRGWVILDWMNARKGHPAADVARSNLMMKIGGPPPGTQFGLLLRIGALIAHRVYRKAIMEKRVVTPDAVDAWTLPVAAARLSENIPGEHGKLMEIIRDLSS